MLNEKFYQAAIELQNLGVNARYDEKTETYGQFSNTSRFIYVTAEGLPEIKISLWLADDRRGWNVKQGMVQAEISSFGKDFKNRDHSLTGECSSIKFSEGKTPKQMALDIKRRLIDESLPKIRKSLEQFQSAQAMRQKQIQTMEAVVKITGSDRSFDPDLGEIIFYKNKTIPALDRVEVGYYNNRIRVRLQDLTLEQFERVCEALK